MESGIYFAPEDCWSYAKEDSWRTWGMEAKHLKTNRSCGESSSTFWRLALQAFTFPGIWGSQGMTCSVSGSQARQTCGAWPQSDCRSCKYLNSRNRGLFENRRQVSLLRGRHHSLTMQSRNWEDESHHRRHPASAEHKNNLKSSVSQSEEREDLGPSQIWRLYLQRRNLRHKLT